MRSNSTKYYSILLCCLIISSVVFGKDVKLNSLKIKGGQSLYFMENKGQIVDQYNNARTDIQYKLSAPGINIFVGNAQMHYQFSKTVNKPEIQTTTYRMDVALQGANTNAQVVAEDKQEYFERYYLPQFGDDGLVTGSFRKITYKNVYNNIDWVIYIKNNKVEYDFVVRPGGNVKDIQLKYGGATNIDLNEDGAMVAATPMGKITEQKPFAYETGSHKEVASKFVLHNNTVSFQVDNYDGTLTIDPFLTWGTYFGGANDDEGRAVATDQQGNVYLTGSAVSTTLATVGTQQNLYGGGVSDAYLTKFNAAGARLWTTYYGGAGADSATAVACDNILGVYIAGSTTTQNNMASNTGYQTVNGGGTDGFLVKFNPATGVRTWGTYFGGTGNDYILDVTTDNIGNVYIGGSTQSTSAIATPGSNQEIFGGTIDGFVAQFNSTGIIQWSTYYGGSAIDAINGLACDNTSDNVYVTGQTNSINAIASPGAYQGALNGTNDALIAKFDKNGILKWSTYFGGSETEQGNAIATDNLGNIVFVGSTASPDGIASPSAFQNTYGGGILDAFIAAFDADGAFTYGTYYGGNTLDYGQAIAFDVFNNMYIAGATYSTSGISSTNGYQPILGGSEDAFFAKFTPYHQRIMGSYYGGIGVDYGYGIAIDAANNVCLGGSTNSPDHISSTGSFQPAFGGGINDGFLATISRDTNVVIRQRYTDTLLCRGSAFHVYDSVNYHFKAGNVFTVQLSDITGSFAAPVNVGTSVATTSGFITCTLPAGTPVGTGYRIRIVATNPAFISPDDIYDIHVINSLPSAPVASSNSPVCAGATLQLNTTADYVIDSFVWSGPNGFTATTQSPAKPNVLVTDSGLYIARNIHDGCPDQLDTAHVIVSTIIPNIIATSNFPVCDGDSILLFGNSDSGIVSYYWTGPNAFTSTDQNPVIRAVNATDNDGYYYLTDTLSGCGSVKDSVLITVNPIVPVTVSISVAPNDTVCYGTNAMFNATFTNGGPNPQFQWLRGDDAIVGALYDYYSAIETANDSVRIVYTSSLACADHIHDTSNLIVITVEPIDTVTVSITSIPGSPFIAQGQEVVYTAHPVEAGPNPTYQWQLNGVDLPGATNSYFGIDTLKNGDTVSVIVYSSYMCRAVDSAMAHVGITIVPAGIQSPAFSDVSLYPNPSTGTFTVKGTLPGISSNSVSIEVINALGQVVYTDKASLQAGMLNTKISLSNVADGVYQLKMMADGQSSITRVTISK